MTGNITVHCPPMPTWRVSSTQRRTSAIDAGVYCMFPGAEESLCGILTFPECNINKRLGLIWMVDKVTASGNVGGFKFRLTLEPEWTVAMLALPCKAEGTIGPYKVKMRFPFCWAQWTGPKEWTVEAVTAFGTVYQ